MLIEIHGEKKSHEDVIKRKWMRGLLREWKGRIGSCDLVIGIPPHLFETKNGDIYLMQVFVPKCKRERDYIKERVRRHRWRQNICLVFHN